MFPSLKDGDIIFFIPYVLNKSKIKIGDIVIFNHPLKNLLLIKRINSITSFGIEVKGDNQDISNDSNFFGLVQKEKIVGIYSTKISYLLINKLKRYFTQ